MPEDVTGEILGVDASVVRKAGQDATGGRGGPKGVGSGEVGQMLFELRYPRRSCRLLESVVQAAPGLGVRLQQAL